MTVVNTPIKNMAVPHINVKYCKLLIPIIHNSEAPLLVPERPVDQSYHQSRVKFFSCEMCDTALSSRSTTLPHRLCPHSLLHTPQSSIQALTSCCHPLLLTPHFAILALTSCCHPLLPTPHSPTLVIPSCCHPILPTPHSTSWLSPAAAILYSKLLTPQSWLSPAAAILYSLLQSHVWRLPAAAIHYCYSILAFTITLRVVLCRLHIFC